MVKIYTLCMSYSMHHSKWLSTLNEINGVASYPSYRYPQMVNQYDCPALTCIPVWDRDCLFVNTIWVSNIF